MTRDVGIKTIVVGVDESQGAAQALRWAIAEGELHDAEVTAVMAWGYLAPQVSIMGESIAPLHVEIDAVETLHASIASAVGADRASLVRAQVVCDLPARALIEASEDADLLVVGARGVGGYRALLLGSVSQHCLHHATTPIAVVRDDSRDREPTGCERIVVAVDGSGPAQRALRWALHEGRLRKAAVEVVNAWQPPYIGYYPYGGESFDPSFGEAASRRVIDDALAAEDTTGLVAPVTRLSIRGRPADSICDASKGADVLVLGSRGLGGVRRALLGSVATTVTHHASRPVVVVVPPDR